MHTTLIPQERVNLRVSSALASFLVALVGLVAANLMPFMLIGLTARFDTSAVTAGAIMTASLLATAVVAVFTLKLVSGPRRRTVAQVGLLLATVGYAGAAFSPSMELTTAAVLIAGAGAGAAVSAGGAALAIFRNPSRVMGLNMLFNRTAIAVLLALIPLISLSVVTAFGSAALVSLLALVTTLWLPNTIAPEDETNASPALTAAPVSRRSITVAGIGLLVAFPVWALTEDSVWAVAGSMGIEQARLSEEMLGLVLSLSTVGGLVGALLIIALGNRFGRALPIAVFLLLGVGLKITLTWTTDPIIFTVALIAGNFAYSILFALIVATAAALDATGKWSGPTLGIYLVGSAFAPFFAAAVAEAFGYQTYGLIIAAMNLCLVIPLAIIARLSSRIENTESPSEPSVLLAQG